MKKSSPEPSDSVAGVASSLLRTKCLLFGASVCAAFTALVAAAAIKIVSPDAVDFGEYPAAESRSASYTFRNTGAEPVKILKIREACGCATASVDRVELSPGEVATLHVDILANSIFESYSKRIYMETSDPGQRLVRFLVQGHPIPLADVKPKRTLYAGRLPLGQAWEQCFDLRTNFPAVVFDQPVIESNYAAEAHMRAVRGTNATHRLLLRLKAPDAPGQWNCAIIVPVVAPSNHPPVKLSVSANIGSEVCVVPKTVWLARSPAPVSHKFMLKLLSPGSSVLDSDAVKWPEREGVSFAPERSSGRMLWFTATFAPTFFDRPPTEETLGLSIRYPDAEPGRIVVKPKP